MSTSPSTSDALRDDGPRLRSFHQLLRHRVLRILLVSSLYDAFIMSEDGQLQETMLSQFMAMNLLHAPDLLRVPDCAQALEVLERDRSFDLVIASVHAGDVDAGELAKRLREEGHAVPVMALAYTRRELADFVAKGDVAELERVFLWQGDTRLLFAMVKSLEDRANVDNDTGLRGVPVVLVVEDNIRFYSSFLPVIYTELFSHTRKLLSADLNVSQKMMRMRARPKVLLCETYEDAWGYFERFESEVIGVISDCEFPREGEHAKDAGFQLCKNVLERRSDIRCVMQSSRPENRKLATELGASFLLKGSPMLLHDLRRIMVERFGFGDFIFRMPGRTIEVDRATDLKSLAVKLRTVPSESIAYHAELNHFSNWLKTRTEFALAEKLRPRKVAEFETVESMRELLIDYLEEAQRVRQRSVIAEFERSRFEPSVSITRIGEGSLGGKARGIAFANRILRHAGIDQHFPSVDIYVPPSVVIGTQTFDEFLEYGDLRDFAMAPNPDQEIARRFLNAPFPRKAVSDMRAFLLRVEYPLAVRSSSLLEDSLSQPFAGVYETYFLPNNDPDIDVRLSQLKAAVKLVYASTFTAQAKAYLSMTSFRLEEEKMGVMIQELVGTRHQDRFYPDFAGVARSYNFYPEPGHAAEDGVVAVALGMGSTVVDGSPCLRFCPKDPRRIVSLSSAELALQDTQRQFSALDLRRAKRGEDLVGVVSYPLDVAERDGALTYLGSTYSPENQSFTDGIARPGVRIVSFAQVLKHGAFPLAEILSQLLVECSRGTGAPVEIEFAGNLTRGRGLKQNFGMLQMRPLALSKERDEVRIGPVEEAEVICRTGRVLGNGRIDDLRDVVFVDVHRFDRLRSREAAQQVARFDAILRREECPYLLVGVGRWGSADPSLGIPVTWDQISGSRVIVEACFKDFKVQPSQGTHFFQNLTSSSVGYFTIDPDDPTDSLDWEWLSAQPVESETEFVRHVRCEAPLRIIMSGETGVGLILKPAEGC